MKDLAKEEMEYRKERVKKRCYSAFLRNYLESKATALTSLDPRSTRLLPASSQAGVDRLSSDTGTAISLPKIMIRF